MNKVGAGLTTEWFVRKYKIDPVTKGLIYGKNGEVLNELVWEDPKIASGENTNVMTDNGRLLILDTLFGLSGSAHPMFMGFGASATAASHLDTRLTHELIADSNRPTITDSAGATLSTSATVLSTYTDTSYTPNYVYYTTGTVMGTINGATSLNVNNPIQEIGIFSLRPCPGTPTGTSGIALNHYVFGTATTLDASTILQAIVVFHI